jgi:hypothetical protein
VITPTDTLVTNNANTKPLIARNPAADRLLAPAREQGGRPPSPTRGEAGTAHGQPRARADEADEDQPEAGNVAIV